LSFSFNTGNATKTTLRVQSYKKASLELAAALPASMGVIEFDTSAYCAVELFKTVLMMN